MIRNDESRLPLWLRRAMAIMASLAFLGSLAFALQSDASANVTSQHCDPDFKYWCFRVYSTPYAGYVSVDEIEYTGGLGNGGARQYQALMERLYREDPSTLIDYLLIDYGPTGWFADTNINVTFHNTYPGYFVSNWAIVVVQDKHQSNVSPFNMFCGNEVDYWLSGPSGPAEFETGGAGPC